MGNLFVNLSLPAGDGAGASVDVSTMGRDKSIVVGGSFEGATIAIEVSTDGGTVFKPICLFSQAGKKVLPTAAEFMRVNVLGRSASPFSANVDVGANDSGMLSLALPVPAVDGPGAPIDVSTLGNFTTYVAGGSFVGTTISIEISEDGVSYSPCGASFSGQGGVQNKCVVANFMRTFVRGRAGNTLPFTPTVSVGATKDAITSLPGGAETLVYQPGGAETGPVIFNTWDALYAKILSIRSLAGGFVDITVAVDGLGNTGAHNIVPFTGVYAPYVLWFVTITAHRVEVFGATAGLEFADGVSVVGLRHFDKTIDVFNSNMTTPLEILTEYFPIIEVNNFSAIHTIDGGAPFYDATNCTSGLRIDCLNASGLGRDTGGGGFEGPVVANVPSGAALQCFAIAENSFRPSFPGADKPNVIQGDVGATLVLITESIHTLPKEYPGWLGTISDPIVTVFASLHTNPFQAPAATASVIANFSEHIRLDASGAPISQALKRISNANYPVTGGLLTVIETGGGDVTLTAAAGDSILGGTKGSEILTLAGQPLDTETVTLGGTVYTFETIFSDTPDSVLIGATASDSIDNIIAAITNGAGEGSLYGTGTLVNEDATAVAGAGDTMNATALLGGIISIASTETLTSGSWGAATLQGGDGGTVAVPPSGGIMLECDGVNNWDVVGIFDPAPNNEVTTTLIGTPGYSQNDLNDYYDGTVMGMPIVTVTSNGTVITAAVNLAGGGDLALRINKTTILWDTTPPATLVLAEGTDEVFQLHRIYATEAAGVVTLASTGGAWPTSGDFAAIAEVYVQTAASLQNDGGFKVHAYTDHTHGSYQGHLAEMNYWMRQQNATWQSGCAPSDLVVSDPDAYISITAGSVLQLHEHTMPARDMQTGSPAWIVNDPTTAWKRITTFDDITQDASGGVILNKWFTLVLWATVNEAEADCKIFFNLPEDTYSTQAAAELDAQGFTNFDIPSAFKGTGFLIAAYIVKGKDSGAWEQGSKVDLRDRNPGNAAGASGNLANHQDLIGRDDPLAHVQYYKEDGTVPLAGPLNHDGSTVGFYGTAPVVQPTGVAVSAAAIHAALVSLGLITA